MSPQNSNQFECSLHSGFEARTKRNEEDISKLWEAITGLQNTLHNLDKRLDGFLAKVAGISTGAMVIITVVFKVVDKIPLFK